jgi:hypothetical protein
MNSMIYCDLNNHMSICIKLRCHVSSEVASGPVKPPVCLTLRRGSNVCVFLLMDGMLTGDFENT